jgi:hypothetical protein
MSAKVKYVINPFTGQFDSVQVKDNISAQSVVVSRECLVSLAVGDLVMESLTIVNGVDKTIDNTDTRPTMGIVLEKPTTTTCKVLLVGTVQGFSGLTKASRVFLNTDGTITDVAVGTGYLQCLGTVRDVDTVDFNPQLIRVKRT